MAEVYFTWRMFIMNNRRLKPYPIAKLSTRRERPRRPSHGYLIPHAEAWQSASELLIEVKLPTSAQPETIDVTFEQGVLTVYGLYEWPLDKRHIPNQFYRCFMIPFSVKATQIKACFQPTLLTLHIPKGELPTPHKIIVQVRPESVMRRPELAPSGTGFRDGYVDFDFELSRFRFNAL